MLSYFAAVVAVVVAVLPVPTSLPLLPELVTTLKNQEALRKYRRQLIKQLLVQGERVMVGSKQEQEGEQEEQLE